ncbi:hypothetical protein GOP47_0017929 [Adiantum capillus-veneris]|uniref:Glycerophosphocholine acyltransferase 1 n=1 Tax=Adiantum capillus-veneris TaxID=13818 RepID=A0A9D4UGC5_ADICA|nr:hypothetical protein GOP47_0017929 [Adiantum capillus-veneris]
MLAMTMSSRLGRHSLFVSPIPRGGIIHTQEVLTRHAHRLAKHADRHEHFLNKVTYCLGVLSFGLFCYLLGSSPRHIPRLYCLFFIFVVPLRWMYYRIKKWHYYLLDFCYYANAIFVSMLLFFPGNSELFMLCFSFSEGPLAWALIVWRCSLVFNSIDKIISVLIHLLPGTVFFILRWWENNSFSAPDAVEENGQFCGWPVVNSSPTQWMWLFFVPLMVYCIWQGLYFLVVEGLRRQRILQDPEIMTSYRELKRKAERAKNIWWRLSGLLGDENRVYMYAILQAAFTVATLAFTVPMFRSYRLHIGFEVFKLAATVWNGGRYVFEVMPRQAAKKLRNDEVGMQVGRGQPCNMGKGEISRSASLEARSVECSKKLTLDKFGCNQQLEIVTIFPERNKLMHRRWAWNGEEEM